MSPRRAEVLRRSSRWLTAAALLTLAPKCVFCVAAYVGLGTALGLGGPELCGATGRSPWASALAVPAIALGVAGLLARFRCHFPDK